MLRTDGAIVCRAGEAKCSSRLTSVTQRKANSPIRALCPVLSVARLRAVGGTIGQRQRGTASSLGRGCEGHAHDACSSRRRLVQLLVSAKSAGRSGDHDAGEGHRRLFMIGDGDVLGCAGGAYVVSAKTQAAGSQGEWRSPGAAKRDSLRAIAGAVGDVDASRLAAARWSAQSSR